MTGSRGGHSYVRDFREVFQMCHICLPKGNGGSVPFYSETPLKKTLEECVERKGGVGECTQHNKYQRQP